MEINLIAFTSELNKPESIWQAHEVLLSEMEKYFKVNIIHYPQLSQLDKQAFNMVFIASGGTERQFVQCFEQLPHPPVLLTDGLQNSLAAALEITSWMRQRGMRTQIIHGNTTKVMIDLMKAYRIWKAMHALSQKRIGVIGTPSSWLIASNVDYLLAKRRWGITYTDIPLQRVYDIYDTIKEEEIGEEASAFASRALACREGQPKDLLNAMRLYKAIKQICLEEKLDALTLSCFTLINKLHTTGCLALSLLNDDGILAGCEGDLQSIFTLLAANTVTDKIGFMANPSLINETDNEVVLAHCTIGTKLTEKFIIRNHFETQSGIAIEGILPTGEITLVKCGGECLDEYFISSGQLIENTSYVNTCRTQVRVTLDTSVSYFFRNPIGNHHILLPGRHTDAIKELFQYNSCRQIE